MKVKSSPGFVRTAAAVLVVSGLLLTLSVFPLSGDDAKPAASGKLPQPVVDTHELMELFGEPYFEYLKEEMSKGAPDSNERWKTVRNRGWQGAEIANLFAMRKVEKNQAEWLEYCAQMQKAGVGMADAAKAKNGDGVKKSYQALVKSCNDCHTAFGEDHAPQLEP